MPQSENISLHELQPTASREPEHVYADQDLTHLEQASLRQSESKKKESMRVVGSCDSAIADMGYATQFVNQNMTHTTRLRHELWCLSGVLFKQLDLPR